MLGFQISTFSHDTIRVIFSKWDDTISGTTCEWTNPELQGGLVLVPVNTLYCRNLLRTEYGHSIDREPSGTTFGWTNPKAQSGLVLVHVNMRYNTHRTQTESGHNIDRKPSKHRLKNE